MKVTETPIPGLLVIEPDVIADHRGYFFESWQHERYKETGIDAEFIQDNESKSTLGVVRGLHYQLDPWSQAKLVRVVDGCVFDVAVDLRKGSPAFGQWYGIELNSDTRKQLFIPRGFAHGFSVLSKTAVFSYKCDNYYNRQAERAINACDPGLAINWNLNEIVAVISEKDKNAPLFNEAEMNFKY